jgi:deleted in liver cancer protein
MKLVGGNYLSVPPAGVVQDTDISPVSNLKRSGSERLRDGAKNFLRRVESIKSRRKKKKNREGVVISGPMHLDIMQLNQKFQNMSTKDPKLCKSSTNSPIVMSPVGNSSTPLFLFADSKICPASEKHVAMFGQHLSPHSKPHPASRTSPLHFFTQKKHHHQQQQQQNEKPTTTADDSSSLCSELSQDSSNGSAEKKLLSPVGRYFYKTKRVDEASGTLSDSEAVKTSRQQKKSKSHKSQKSSTLTRGGGGSFNLGHDSNRQHRDSFKTRRIFRSRSAVRHNSTNDNDKKDVDVQQQPKSGLVVQRWHSFRAQTSTKRDFADGEGVSLCKLSCGQIEKLRKLALVTLTGYMERLVDIFFFFFFSSLLLCFCIA